MAFCIVVSLTAFAVVGIFSTSAYSTQLPLLAGLTAALERVSKPLRENLTQSQGPQFNYAPYLPPHRAVARIAPAPSAALRS
jgi:hypothetical protein